MSMGITQTILSQSSLSVWIKQQMTFFLNQKVKYVTLVTDINNLPARNLYEKIGFEFWLYAN